MPFTYHEARANTTNGQRAVSFRAVNLWNNLPNYLKEMSSRDQFKTKLKCHFYEQYIINVGKDASA